MSDQFDALFDGLRGRRAPEPFAPAAVVRRRGRQRARRQALSLGVAVLVVAGGGAGGLAAVASQRELPPPPAATAPSTGGSAVQSPVPTTGPSSSPAPAPTKVPDRWLLTAEDLGPGAWARPESDRFELDGGPWIWAGRCVLDRDFEEIEQSYPSLRRRVDIAVIDWEDRQRGPEDPGWRVNQTVELFDEGGAVANLADLEAVVQSCDNPEQTSWQVVERGFAGGDGSLLVSESSRAGGETFVSFYGVARVGDAVSTVWSTDKQLVRLIVPSAADRLAHPERADAD